MFGIEPSKQQVCKGLQPIARYLQNPPNSIYFTVNELDELVAGQAPDVDRDRIEAGGYLDGFLSVVEWWMATLDIVARESSSWNASPDAPFEKERQQSIALLRSALSAYPSAVAGTYAFSEDIDTAAHIKLLKSYHLFTRYVCSFAELVWPGVDFAALRAQF